MLISKKTTEFVQKLLKWRKQTTKLCDEAKRLFPIGCNVLVRIGLHDAVHAKVRHYVSEIDAGLVVEIADDDAKANAERARHFTIYRCQNFGAGVLYDVPWSDVILPEDAQEIRLERRNDHAI